MHEHAIRKAAIAAGTLVSAMLLSGCALGPRPLSAEENIWFNIATGSDVHGVPPPSPYYPPYARPYPAYALPYRPYAPPAPSYVRPPPPAFVPDEPPPQQ